MSTWCDIICRELPQVEFTLYAITGAPEVSLKFDPPPNARRIVHVPLWGTRDPAEQLHAGLPYAEIRRRRAATTDEVVAETFLPLFCLLLQGMAVEGTEVREYGVVVYRLWQFFQAYDWKRAWQSPLVYDAFAAELNAAGDEPTVADLSTAMQWFASFLLPLAAPVPESDLVHSTIAGFAGLPGIVAKHRDGTPFVVTEHGVFVRERYIAISAAEMSPFAKRFLMALSSFVAKLNYAHADLVAPVVRFNRRWELRYGADPVTIEPIYNGIDPGLFVPKPKPPSTAGGPVAIAAARIFPLKDIETMIRASGVARELVPGIRFVVYGSLDADVPYVARCRALVAELGLQETFELAGFHPKPPDLYSEGDVCVLSSISEAFPYTVLEAMSCARPVVGTDVGGVREALEGFGVVVPPRDPEALGKGVAMLFDDDEFRRELGRRAREEVLAKYRTSDSVQAYWAVYRRLTAEPRAA